VTPPHTPRVAGCGRLSGPFCGALRRVRADVSGWYRRLVRHPRTSAAIVILALLTAGLVGCSGKEKPAQVHPGTPALVAQAAPSGTPSGSASPSASAAPGSTVAHAFPVIGKASYGHTHHDYPATDIITACGNKVVAAVTGVILAVSLVDTWTAKENLGATRGGLSVSILGDDGVRYYGSHLRLILDTVRPGVRVTAGQQLGEIGDTGDASACHLHFGISPPCAKHGDWWNQRGTLFPWPYLDSWRKDGQKSAVAAVKAWQKKHG